MITIPKILITLGVFLAFHSAYSVSKSNILYLLILTSDKNHFYNANNAIDFTIFPIELIVEMSISFLLVILSSLVEYSNFDEIYYDKQLPDKMVHHLEKNMFTYVTSKGGMINHYLKLEK